MWHLRTCNVVSVTEEFDFKFNLNTLKFKWLLVASGYHVGQRSGKELGQCTQVGLNA